MRSDKELLKEKIIFYNVTVNKGEDVYSFTPRVVGMPAYKLQKLEMYMARNKPVVLSTSKNQFKLRGWHYFFHEKDGNIVKIKHLYTLIMPINGFSKDIITSIASYLKIQQYDNISIHFPIFLAIEPFRINGVLHASVFCNGKKIQNIYSPHSSNHPLHEYLPNCEPDSLKERNKVLSSIAIYINDVCCQSQQ